MALRSSYACLTAAEIAVIFFNFDGWVRSTAGSTLFPRGGAAGGACLPGKSGAMGWPISAEVLNVVAQTDQFRGHTRRIGELVMFGAAEPATAAR
jgi:hypothetical protein